jgi:hypothetical protein
MTLSKAIIAHVWLCVLVLERVIGGEKFACSLIKSGPDFGYDWERIVITESDGISTDS